PTVYQSGDYKYILLADGTAQIIDYSGSAAELTVPDVLDGYSVSSIGDSAFYSCKSLATITLSDSVTEMGINPFAYCEQLTNIQVSPDHPVFATIDGVLFNKTEKKLVCYPYGFTATEYQVPKGIRSIGDAAFFECRSLTAITLPEGITSIGDFAFYGCDSLAGITMPEGITSIGDAAFAGCDSLTGIMLPEGLTSIGDFAFIGCSSLTAITLPEGLTSIGDEAFAGCNSLTAITLPDSITEMGINPFAYCEQLTNIQVSPNPPVFATIEGVLFNKTEKKLVCYPGGFTATEYQVPKGIRSIGDYAFYTCMSLTAITLPEGVTNIGDEAFYYCKSLTAITLPESMESIGTDAFADCPKNMQFTVVRDSYAAKWCKENGLNYTYPDALDWLND
ncbi:MAG: leucine-rich repeat domain-containing protein, partial [Clostridia bacterium]|nr:leucine-rich repeat domain-containing protein [Clostridia bacterium]